MSEASDVELWYVTELHSPVLDPPSTGLTWPGRSPFIENHHDGNPAKKNRRHAYRSLAIRKEEKSQDCTSTYRTAESLSEIYEEEAGGLKIPFWEGTWAGEKKVNLEQSRLFSHELSHTYHQLLSLFFFSFLLPALLLPDSEECNRLDCQADIGMLAKSGQGRAATNAKKG